MKAIVVIDVDEQLLNGNYYAEVNIKPKNRKRNWNKAVIESELKSLPKERYKETFSDIAGAIDYGWNSCLAALEGKDTIDKVIETLNEKLDSCLL